MFDRLIIMGIARRIAPAVVRRDRRGGQGGLRRPAPIRPIEHVADRPHADRTGAVALVLAVGGDQTALAQGATDTICANAHYPLLQGGEDHGFSQ